MKYKLNTSIIKQEGILLFCGKKNFRLPTPQSAISLEMLEALSHGISNEELQCYKKNPECSHLLELFSNQGLLISVKEHYTETALEKTYDFLSYHLGKLSNPFDFHSDIHIGIIGCGGTGANIAMCLALSGVKRISLIDYDIVDITNLNRQFAYDCQDLGASKTLSLKNKLIRLNPNLSIKTYEQKITKTQDLNCLSKDINFLVSAIDKPAIKASYFTVQYALNRDIPIILGAVGYDSFDAGPLLSTLEAKRNYLSKLTKILDSETQPVTGSIASTNLMLSAMLANDVTAWFYPFAPINLLNTRKIYNPSSLALIGETYYGDN
ncbi:ThiF family adenylyltransferase [Vibrio cholerae]|uniref:ThiF family adenylyltransferase n=1 Tax=Vibrio cholerae TaxID=666 RepID=UPI001159229D|nr:ThiF family adenylyltransferase [Vibrio cholerae]TQQ04259.1 ThiF family adenylyltransferase [Vibrio cholerae]